MEKNNAALPQIPINMPSERQNAQKGIIANKLSLMSGKRRLMASQLKGEKKAFSVKKTF